jgi:neutral trehalase
MNTKLTLSLDAKVIEAAKKYAIEKGLSLSEAVEGYLKNLTLSKHKTEKRSSVSELKGILENTEGTEGENTKKRSIMELRGIGGNVPNDFDYREERYDYLMKKHK